MTETITTINIPLRIPTVLIEAGAIEKYAKSKGWQATFIDYEEDGLTQKLDENGVGLEIDNPITAVEYTTSWIQDWVKNDYKAVAARLAALEAQETIVQQIDSLFQTGE